VDVRQRKGRRPLREYDTIRNNYFLLIGFEVSILIAIDFGAHPALYAAHGYRHYEFFFFFFSMALPHAAAAARDMIDELAECAATIATKCYRHRTKASYATPIPLFHVHESSA